MDGTPQVNTSTMEPRSDAQPPVSESLPQPAEQQPKQSTRKRRSRSGSGPASAGSAAAKGRQKRAQTPEELDYTRVGRVIHEAVLEGIEPEALLEEWRARVASWDKVHGGGK